MCRLIAVVCLFFVLASSARAWNEVGHAIIAKIAFEELGKESPKLQLQLFEMLKKHSHFDDFLGKNRPAECNPAEWALIRASNWPDWVRPGGRDGVRADRVSYHRGPDHYINRPIVITEGPNALPGKLPDFDPDIFDIAGAFRQRMGELSERLVAAPDKAVAICWIAHLVGDVHQPLHAGTQFSKQFPTGDLGGNLFRVSVGGRVVNLHAFWDNALGEVPGWQNDTPEHQAQVYALVVKVTESLRAPSFSRPALADNLARHPYFADWIEESHELAKSAAYRNGDRLLEAAAGRDRGGVEPNIAPDVGPGYEQRAAEVSRRRAAEAGYRLADKLKVALARQP